MKIERDGRPYVRCELCNKFATFDHAVMLGWDWFTGRLKRTHHYCKGCKTSHQHNEMLRTSGCK